MANPAELLYGTLTRWRANKGHNADPDEQRIAVRHLDAISELLDVMDDAGLRTALYRKYYDKWVGLTLHNPHEWQTQTTHFHIDDAALENLDHLGDRLNGVVEKLQDGGLDAVQTYVNGVRELLDEDDSITDASLRRHVKQVLAHVEWCIRNYDAVGEFDLQEAIERLLAAMVRATAASSRQDRWKDKLKTMMWPFAREAALAIATSPIQLAIAAAFGS
ncbi:hypothetical protein EV580_0102 [Mycobacterium sp. BK086]|uniref:hypothetical protein n=1 Tax=Mycobacterium sp. BK086 TaxID=2512165 RepID=UPI00106145A7|nr:hypothetical protein [Mycobacterium sp. BK086]TDO16938.1 hypothetical protein EV580_0102 [Mycobacterium sp. BK086]